MAVSADLSLTAGAYWRTSTRSVNKNAKFILTFSKDQSNTTTKNTEFQRLTDSLRVVI